MSTMVREQPDIYQRFFSVASQGQSYLNIVYLLLSFPLGLIYFVFLITGLSLGVSLAIIWVGIPILLLVLAAWWGMLLFEREIAVCLLHVDIAPLAREANPPQGMWARIKATLVNPVTWKGLFFLIARFPLGILAFVIVVTWFSLTASLIAAPFIYSVASINIGAGRVASLSDALLCAVIGLVIGFAGMHLMNLVAYVYGQFARLMLDTTRSSAPVERSPEQAAAAAGPIVLDAAPEAELAPVTEEAAAPARRRRRKTDE